MLTQHLPDLGRRTVLGLAMAAVVSAAPWRPTFAGPADTAPQTPIMQLDNALLAAMKAGDTASFDNRYRALEPVIEQVFNLDAVLGASIGLSWATMSDAQKAKLEAAFRRYTVSSYVSNFDSYNGQSFEILPGVRPVGNGEVVVQTRLIRTDDSPVKLDYVMRQGPAGWQVVDVLTDGSISRVAVQRSDFRQLLLSGGVPALAAGLGRKVASLSGGMLS
ncbi:MAG TPA: ABC transporter substrate-binding protein [Acetobacteraceae bacterium]|nr:ABC transporter substrate-binding protein [Acetobacteraceae bacterium]